MIAIEHYTQADKKKSKLLISQFRNFVIIVAKRILNPLFSRAYLKVSYVKLAGDCNCNHLFTAAKFL